MERYFFHLHECGTHIPDDEGRGLAGMEEARSEAIKAARDVMSAEVQAGRLCLGCRIDVKDGNGRLVLTVPFSDALTISGL